MAHYSLNPKLRAKLSASLVKSKKRAESLEFTSPSKIREIEPTGSILLINKRIVSTSQARKEIAKYRNR